MKNLFLLVYDHTYGRWIVISLPITQPWQHLQQGKAAVFLVGWVLPNFSGWWANTFPKFGILELDLPLVRQPVEEPQDWPELTEESWEPVSV